MIPYMIFIDARGIIRGDFNGKDGFFGEADKRIRARTGQDGEGRCGQAGRQEKVTQSPALHPGLIEAYVLDRLALRREVAIVTWMAPSRA